MDQVPNFDDVFERKTPAQVQVMLDEFLLDEADAEGVSVESTKYEGSTGATDVDKAFAELLS